jgi:hypothetical protein
MTGPDLLELEMPLMRLILEAEKRVTTGRND